MNLPALVEEDGSNLHRQSHIEDLDEFFKNAYAYFYHKGLDYVAVAIAEITNLAFTIFFSVFALLLDWNAVLHDCSSSVEAQRQCHGALSDYIVMPWSRQISVFYGVFILMYMLLFVCYLVWKILRAVKLISEGVSMRKFFEHKLYVAILFYLALSLLLLLLSLSPSSFSLATARILTIPTPMLPLSSPP